MLLHRDPLIAHHVQLVLTNHTPGNLQVVIHAVQEHTPLLVLALVRTVVLGRINIIVDPALVHIALLEHTLQPVPVLVRIVPLEPTLLILVQAPALIVVVEHIPQQGQRIVPLALQALIHRLALVLVRIAQQEPILPDRALHPAIPAR
jgi:hypothetical protein